MSSISVEFVVPQGEASAEHRLQHIAIQATAVMLQGWFEEKSRARRKQARWWPLSWTLY